MKYNTWIFAAAFGLLGGAHAGDDMTISNSEQNDYKVECIEAAIADELPDDQMELFVEQCLEEKLATVRKIRQQTSGNKS